LIFNLIFDKSKKKICKTNTAFLKIFIDLLTKIFCTLAFQVMVKIKWRKYIIVAILLILLPFSMHWKFLIDGELTNSNQIVKEINSNPTKVQLCAIKYVVDGESYYIKDVAYNKNLNSIRVLYRKSNPTKATLFSFSYMYFNLLFSISIILFILWNAFFFSFRKKEIFPGASSFFNVSKKGE
jgi:hypothetical protein